MADDDDCRHKTVLLWSFSEKIQTGTRCTDMSDGRQAREPPTTSYISCDYPRNVTYRCPACIRQLVQTSAHSMSRDEKADI